MSMQLLMARARMNHRSASGDPYWANVSSLLHFDGSNGGTIFTDETGIIWTRGGGAVISTAESKFGGSSLYLDGSSSLATATASAFAFGTGDFTLEMFMKSSAGVGVAFDTRVSGSQAGVFIMNDSTVHNGPTYYQTSTGNIGSTIATNDGAWHHVAWCRASGVFRIFVDGVSGYSSTGISSSDFGSSRPGFIGEAFSGGANYTGYLDEIRTTKGVARYTSNFTPPVEAFPNHT